MKANEAPEQYISKSALVAEIERRRESNAKEKFFGRMVEDNYFLDFINTLEVKEVDLELIVGWFNHIAQMADDRKTLNGEVMEDWAALDEIKCLAKNSSEFIQIHCKTQKGK